MPIEIPPEIAAAAISHHRTSAAPSAGASPDQRSILPTPHRIPRAVEISESQQAGITHLAEGKSIAETARLIGVNRTTVYRWMANDHEFQAALNAWRHELRTSARDRLLALCDVAIDTVASSVAGQNHKLAYSLLKDIGILTRNEPDSPDADDLAKRVDLAERSRKTALAKEERKVKTDEEDVEDPELVRELHDQLRAQAAASAAARSATEARRAGGTSALSEQFVSGGNRIPRHKHPFAKSAETTGKKKAAGSVDAADHPRQVQ